jgi:hypothetical protein
MMSAFTRSTPEFLRKTGRCVAQGLTLAMMISSRDKYGRTPLSLAAENEHEAAFIF